MLKVYVSSVLVVSVMVGSMGTLAYQLGRFNAQVTNEMVASFAQGNKTESVASNVVYPFPIKKAKKHRIMLARK